MKGKKTKNLSYVILKKHVSVPEQFKIQQTTEKPYTNKKEEEEQRGIAWMQMEREINDSNVASSYLWGKNLHRVLGFLISNNHNS